MQWLQKERAEWRNIQLAYFVATYLSEMPIVFSGNDVPMNSSGFIINRSFRNLLKRSACPTFLLIATQKMRIILDTQYKHKRLHLTTMRRVCCLLMRRKEDKNEEANTAKIRHEGELMCSQCATSTLKSAFTICVVYIIDPIRRLTHNYCSIYESVLRYFHVNVSGTALRCVYGNIKDAHDCICAYCTQKMLQSFVPLIALFICRFCWKILLIKYLQKTDFYAVYLYLYSIQAFA